MRFVREHQVRYPVRTLCRTLGVSPSGYYAWLVRGPSERDLSDEWLLARIRAIHERSDGTYGAPRIHEELKAEGVPVGRKRIARLLRRADLQGVSRRRRFRTTTKDPKARPHEDLVERNFTALGPDQLWVSGIERHEALSYRVEVKGLHPRAVAAAREKLGAARPWRRRGGWQAAPTTTGRVGTARRPGSGKQGGKVYARNQCHICVANSRPARSCLSPYGNG